MSHYATYVIGAPGAGKTTLLDHLTRGLPVDTAETPFPHRRYDCGVLELGRRRHEFSGTDALSMSIQPVVTTFIEGVRPRMLLAEGYRLGNDKFFRALVSLGYELTVYVIAGPRVATMRALRGSEQNATWAKGRETKVAKLSSAWDATVLTAGARLADLEGLMNDPVALALKEARNA
jgi:P-loop Nucleotide Kinase3